MGKIIFLIDLLFRECEDAVEDAVLYMIVCNN